MPDAVFKDLCLDAVRPDVVADFWGAVLGLAVVSAGGRDRKLQGARSEQTVWVNEVPEPLTVKNRVHLDVRFPHGVPAEIPVVEEHEHWTVGTDPEGLVFCAFGPRDDEPAGAFELVVDAVDPLAIAQWWADRTGATLHRSEGEPWVWLEGVAGFPWPYWVFGPVPEPKTVKNRVHWDVTGEVEVLRAAGATVLDQQPSWTVLADPEGNEFCCFSP